MAALAAASQPEPEPEPGPEPREDAQADAPAPPAANATQDPRSTRDYGFFSGRYDPAKPPNWAIEFEPLVWYAAPAGDIELNNGDLVAISDLNLDSPRLSEKLHINGRVNRWTLSLLGSLVESSGGVTLTEPVTLGSTSFAIGDELSSSVRLDSAEFHAGYRVAEFGGRPNDRGLSRFYTRMDVVTGLRFYDFEFETRGVSVPGRVATSITHLEPLLGFRYSVELEQSLHAELEVNFGWTPEFDGQGSRSGSIQAGISYRPLRNYGVQVGYQLRTSDIRNSESEFSGSVAGLFAGLTVRF